MTIENFYTELLQEIKSTQVSEDDGAVQEQIFTQLAIDLLADSGETENARVCFDRKENKLGRTMHKLNGYALSENYETLDLFISIFKGVDEPFVLTKQEAESSINQVERFFKNAIYKDYISEIEESSEVFDLAHTLAEVDDVKEFLTRVNIFILTNGVYKSDIKNTNSISNYSIYIRIIDVEYLFNISDQSRVPIELNFEEYGQLIPCLKSPNKNKAYETYLALIPGSTLVKIYEEYGSRLLEQNVRSFLQFTGKINKGIRKTIREEPYMFLAFNNGIAATADELEMTQDSKGQYFITRAKDFQIVNGGQTTASIYHTWKKDRAEIDNIYVQTKITVVKMRENFDEIVTRIAEYANTQNKVSTADLSSNKQFHVDLEKISRSIWLQPDEGSNIQTRWFYERARGQYRNARLKEGYTSARRKAFDKRNPRSQMITKELLAKYLNCYEEVWHGKKKLVIGPHIVVRGSQKNYVQFLNFNMPSKPDTVFFEDTVAKAIMFTTAEKLYGKKPNAIGDMRYITVPYSIALLNLKTDYKIDLLKIWKNQTVSDKFKSIIFDLMEIVEVYIKKTAPGSLYSEWAKKQECWEALKANDFDINFNGLALDFIDPESPKRKSLSDNQVDSIVVQQEVDLIQSISPEKWGVIEQWGAKTDVLSQYLRDCALNISVILRKKENIKENLRKKGISIIELIVNNAPELLDSELPKGSNDDVMHSEDDVIIDNKIVLKMIEWDSRVNILSAGQRNYLVPYAYENKRIVGTHKLYIKGYFEELKKAGFKV